VLIAITATGTVMASQIAHTRQGGMMVSSDGLRGLGREGKKALLGKEG